MVDTVFGLWKLAPQPSTDETLLIVEDSLVLRDSLADILRMEGYTVLTAEDGAQAVEVLSRVTPDLIISDINMPNVDGFGLLRRLRSDAHWMAIPFIFLTAHGGRDEQAVARELGVEEFLVKPVARDDLMAAIQSRLTRARQVRLVQLQQAYEDTLVLFANMIEKRDAYTRGHVERVSAYAMVLADALEWTEPALSHLRLGAILHDIGKILINESVLRKPGPLTDSEWQLVRAHPLTGSEMVSDIPFLAPAIPVIRHHHERWDGGGYPHGLAGEDIPAAARIVAIADGFDTLTSTRPYSAAHTLNEAFIEIVAGAGKRYDPHLVDVFRQAWDANHLHSIAQLWRNKS